MKCIKAHIHIIQIMAFYLFSGKPEWQRCQNNVVDVLKKTFGIMVFEGKSQCRMPALRFGIFRNIFLLAALYPQLDFSDETIQRIQGIFDTNAIEIRLAQSEVMALYKLACMLENNCCPNIRMTFDSKYHVSVSVEKHADGNVTHYFFY